MQMNQIYFPLVIRICSNVCHKNYCMSKKMQIPKENSGYSIGIIAAPRQTGIRFRSPGKEKGKGHGTFVHERGSYQFTGHTAAYLKQGNEVKIAEGFVPHGITAVVKAVVGGLIFKKSVSVSGHFQNDIALFSDPTCKNFEVQVPKAVADKFASYFAEAKNRVNQYGFEPGKGSPYTTKNCVYAAINIVIDFIYENQNMFTQEEWEKIEPKVQAILEDTSSRSYCLQGLLMANMDAWDKGIRMKLSNEISEYLKQYLKDLEKNKNTNSTEISMVKGMLKILRSNPEVNMDMLEYVNNLATHLEKKGDKTSMGKWLQIQKNNNLDIRMKSTEKSYQELANNVGITEPQVKPQPMVLQLDQMKDNNVPLQQEPIIETSKTNFKEFQNHLHTNKDVLGIHSVISHEEKTLSIQLTDQSKVGKPLNYYVKATPSGGIAFNMKGSLAQEDVKKVIDRACQAAIAQAKPGEEIKINGNSPEKELFIKQRLQHYIKDAIKDNKFDAENAPQIKISKPIQKFRVD